MTTPTTAELRAWARAQGMDVGDRGRLSPDVRAAWDAAHGAGGPAASSRVAAATTSRRAAAATVRPAPRRSATRRAEPKAGAGTATRAAVETPAPSSPPEVVVREDPRVDDLERKLGELARRVAQLERAAAAPPPRRGFRRRG